MCGWQGIDFINGRCPNALVFQGNVSFSCINSFKPKNNSILHIAPNYGEYLYIKNTLQPNVYAE